MNNWIAITDKLPDYDVPVLWYTEDGHFHIEDLDKDGNPWLFGEEFQGFTIPPVTHWQNLPEPPKIHSQQEIDNLDNWVN